MRVLTAALFFGLSAFAVGWALSSVLKGTAGWPDVLIAVDGLAAAAYLYAAIRLRGLKL